MALAFGGASAQTSPSPAAISEVLVTGTRIPGALQTSVLPITTTTSDELNARGFANLADAINALPVAGVGVTPVASESTFGRNYVNLFNLGANRTLTLVNGQRFISGNPASPFSNAAPGGEIDLNVIPSALVDHIDVVQAGGGTTYGSDAIAGVVNVLLKDHFKGIEVDLQSGLSARHDAAAPNAQLTLGQDFLNGRANLALALQWNTTSSLLGADRPQTAAGYSFAANPLNASASDGVPAAVLIANDRVPEITFGGVPFSAATFNVARIITMPDPNNPGQRVPAQFALGGQLIPYDIGAYRQPGTASGGQGLNLADFTSLQTALDRRLATAVGHIDLSPQVRLTGEAEISQVKSNDPANSPIFNAVLFAPPSYAVPVSVANPFLSDQARSILLSQGIRVFFLSRASVDLTPDTTVRSEERTHRFVVGLDGDLDPAGRHYHWSLNANYGRSAGGFSTYNIIQSRFALAVDAVVNPANGQIVCRSSLANPANGCVPLNLFGQGAPSAAAVAYVSGLYGADYAQTQTDFEANFGGDLLRLPGGEARFNLGVEYRREAASFSPNDNARLGVTRAIAIVPTTGAYDTQEWYAETKLPLISPALRIPLIHRLEAQASYRLVDNSTAGHDYAWSYGAVWAPIADLTLRASRSRSFRAPAITELYLPQQSGFLTGTDPCDARNITSGPNPTARAANCRAALQALGLPANYSLTSNIQTVSVQGVTGGNPGLKNETSQSWNAGAAYQPHQIKGLSLAVERLNVNIARAITSLSASAVLSGCYDSPGSAPGLCGQFTRDASGQIGTITTGYVNAGYTRMDGETISIQQAMELGRWGGLRLGVEAFHLDRLDTSLSGGGYDVVHQAGQIGSPRWKGRISAAYDGGRFGGRWTTEYLGESTFDNTYTVETQDILKVKAYALHDLSAYYRIADPITVRAGINNLFDVRPPYPLPATGTNAIGGSASGAVYDQIGRFWFVGLNAKF